MQRLNVFLGSNPEYSESSRRGLRSIQDVKFNSDASLIASCDLGGNVVLFDGQVYMLRLNCNIDSNIVLVLTDMLSEKLKFHISHRYRSDLL